MTIDNRAIEQKDILAMMGRTDANFARQWQIQWINQQDKYPTPSEIREATIDAVNKKELQVTGK